MSSLVLEQVRMNSLDEAVVVVVASLGNTEGGGDDDEHI
jgi:hypothetical protein